MLYILKGIFISKQKEIHYVVTGIQDATYLCEERNLLYNSKKISRKGSNSRQDNTSLEKIQDIEAGFRDPTHRREIFLLGWLV